MKTLPVSSMLCTNILSRLKYVLITTAIISVLCCGCIKSGVKEYIDVSHDHRILTKETCNKLVELFDAEKNDMKAKGNFPPEFELQYTVLIERLRTMIEQSEVMDDYVNATMVDAEMVQKMINSIWQNKLANMGEKP